MTDRKQIRAKTQPIAKHTLERDTPSEAPRADLKPQIQPTPPASAKLGAKEEQVDRSLTPAPSGEKADVRKEDTPG